MSKRIKLEYLVLASPEPMQIKELDERGKEGWQLCGVLQYGHLIRYHFKRLLRKREPVVEIAQVEPLLWAVGKLLKAHQPQGETHKDAYDMAQAALKPFLPKIP